MRGGGGLRAPRFVTPVRSASGLADIEDFDAILGSNISIRAKLCPGVEGAVQPSRLVTPVMGAPALNIK
jgi:hypothetical protein